MSRGYPTLTFQVGFDRLYVVKNVKTFLEHVSKEEEVTYGKGLTLCHAMAQFDEQSQALIALLMNEFRTFRSFEPGYGIYDNYSYGGYLGNKGGIQLTGEPFDRFFQMYLHQDLGSTRWNPSIVLEDGNPPVAMQLQKEKNVANLTVELPRGTSFFGNARALYAFYDRKLLRCSRDFQERVYPCCL